MLDLLSITGVIFALIVTGYLSVRAGVFFPTEMGTLGKYIVTLALPALIFHAVTSRPLAEIAAVFQVRARGWRAASRSGSCGTRS